MLYRTGLKYNKLNNLIKFQEQAGNSSYATEYNYDKDDRTTKIAFQSGSTIRGVEYVYDKVNRVGSVKRSAATITKVSGKKDKVIAVTENAALGTTYALAGDTTYGAQATTPLVAGITHGTGEEILPFVYDYDNTGNITTEWQGDIGTHYAYDALGQLIRVVSPFEADVEGNPSLREYDYDRGGNMLEKRRYRYIYNAQGEQVKSDLLERRVYTYGDANRKDKLTAYDGKPITHDAIGNPLTYDGWTYTWQAGRQLSSMAKSGTNVGFKYDASGLRTRKTVNGVVTDYTLHGKLVTGLKQGANIMHFFYDKDSRPQMVAYNGTLCTYVHNLQGDIASIVDNVGTKVVEYKYDVWGKPIGAPWTLTIAYEALATLNPFRYRGYVWDTETGLYYLRSRYYNPDWGRFLNADMVLASVGDICGHNAFTYGGNNPIMLKDDEGMWPAWVTAVVAVVAAVVTAAVIVAAAPAAACVATAGLMYMGASAAAASTIATVGTSVGVGVGLLAAADGATTAVTGTSPVRELVFNGDQGAYEMFQMAGAMSTAGLTYAASISSMVGTCFVVGTLIETENGQEPIEEISPDELVWAEDPETGEKALKRVVQTFVRESEVLLHLTADGDEIVTTPEHPFYVLGKGWTQAGELKRGDQLVSRDGKRIPVEKVWLEQPKEARTVYNFEVEDFHTYFVGAAGLLVHNTCHGNSLQSTKTNYGYVLKREGTNEILKYGESIYGLRRYSDTFYTSNGYRMEIVKVGSKLAIHQWQHSMIEGYTYITGQRPPLNRSMW